VRLVKQALLNVMAKGRPLNGIRGVRGMDEIDVAFFIAPWRKDALRGFLFLICCFIVTVFHSSFGSCS
jgi:hypothetical protein